MSQHLIVVSHRGPFRFVEGDDGFVAERGAGGIVSALSPLLSGTDHAATWVAAALGDGDRAAVRAGCASAPGVDLRLLDLDPDDHRLHYDIVSNAVLWFVHHAMFDLVRQPRFDDHFREAWEAYERVNRAFADAVLDSVVDGATVLVQDYQLSLVPGMLRTARPDLRVSFFSHTPFASPDWLRVLPADVAAALMESLGSVPSGFHAQRWVDAYSASARAMTGADPVAYIAPLGPDRDALTAVAASAEAAAAGREIDERVGDRAVVFRSDRIEPSKNIVRGFLAYDLLLARRADLRERVVFLASMYRSRDSLPAYLAYANEVEQVVARVNQRWGVEGWEPVVLDVRDDYARSVAGMKRYDVLFVNPIRDGLNLVAKEGPLVNERDGVVCLSPEAGAHEELGGAVLDAHPFDVDQMARALAAALDEPAGARAERAARLRELAARHTPQTWLDAQLRVLGADLPSGA